MSTFFTPITMAEPPPTMDGDHDDKLPKKKKPRRPEKPVPQFPQDLDILMLLFYERPVRKRVVGARNAKYDLK